MELGACVVDAGTFASHAFEGVAGTRSSRVPSALRNAINVWNVGAAISDESPAAGEGASLDASTYCRWRAMSACPT